MATAREVYASFSVTSACLCFGALHNIWDGASVPVQGFPIVRLRRGGTVQAHQLEFNVPAQNGIWTTFRLVDVETKRVSGWFISHSDADPDQGIDKLLRVSGSPYEPDSGNRWNSDQTSAEGVLVINRYDWGYYDERFMKEIGEGAEEGEDDILGNSNSAGLVDYAHAKGQVRQWKEQRLSERGSSETGIWMYIPQGEYMFGRFGFDDAHTAARSFLFFAGSTAFTRTTFAGLQQPLRKEETSEERFERRLREGHDFSGLKELREMSTLPDDLTIPSLSPPPPLESECLGPYDRREHILRAQDLDALRLLRKDFPPQIEDMLQGRDIDVDAFRRDHKIAEFVDPWKEPVYDLLNELALSYLERFVFPHHSHGTPSAAAEALFPNHADSTARKKLDFHLYPYFTQPHAKPIPDFDGNFVGSRIKDFLRSRSGDRPMDFNEECNIGICRVIAYLISEVLELSSNHAFDSYRNGILPCGIRIRVNLDPELRDVFQYSTVLWKGRE